MTSKIKVDNINKVSDDSNIIKKCGTTTTIGSGTSNPIVVDGSAVTLGRCGGTVVLASGATQTGFGRTGTVNWVTTPVTSTPTTGVNGAGYFINSSGGAKTVNLPASPSAGDIMAISDYAQSSGTNNITIGRNGSNIQGDASDLVISRKGVALTLVFVDATKGWVVTDSGAEADAADPLKFIEATGGTVTTSGDFKVHTFTGPGTFTVSDVGGSGSSTIDYLVVAAGGGGGAQSGGGGGAGGMRFSACTYTSPSPLKGTALPVAATSYPITIGGGGAGGATGPGNPNSNKGASGNPSTFAGSSTILSTGGGGGGANGSAAGLAGGSGGGGAVCVGAGGAGNTPPVSPSQGNAGGQGGDQAVSCQPSDYGGSGGGAGEPGRGGPGLPNPSPVAGGDGIQILISGSNTYYAGGAGGGQHPAGPPAAGGQGGGGNGGIGPSNSGITAGTANTGGGGGGSGEWNVAGSAGGSGVVIIRYKFQ